MVDMVDRKLIRMVVLVAFKAITMPHDGLHTHQEVTMMAGMERPHGTVLMGHSVDCVPSLCRYVADIYVTCLSLRRYLYVYKVNTTGTVPVPMKQTEHLQGSSFFTVRC